MDRRKTQRIARRYIAPIQNDAGLIFAAIIDHQHFEVAGHLAHLFGCGAHDAFNRVLIVIRGKKGAK